MKVIGITGGVGAGKSEILHYLEEKYHARIVEADRAAHFLMEAGNVCYEEIVKTFGSDILNSDKTIDRDRLGKIVFKDQRQLSLLNEIVHPRVKELIVSEIQKERRKQKSTLFIIEAALLLEDHYDMICDEIWYIYADEKVRTERLKKTRGYSEEKIAGIMANQKSPEEFRKACQAVIDNSGLLKDTYAQIDRRLKK